MVIDIEISSVKNTSKSNHMCVQFKVSQLSTSLICWCPAVKCHTFIRHIDITKCVPCHQTHRYITQCVPCHQAHRYITQCVPWNTDPFSSSLSTKHSVYCQILISLAFSQSELGYIVRFQWLSLAA